MKEIVLQAGHQTHQRAILLFTRSPENEARQKPLSGSLSYAERVELYESFTRHVLGQSDLLACPIIIVTDKPKYDFSRFSAHVAAVFPQHGKSFGEKIAEAFSKAFALGYENVVCVGNDCLDLTEADLQAAFEQLACHALVLGAAKDGGAYLIGARRAEFEAAIKILQACRWHSVHAFSDLLGSAHQLDLSARIIGGHSDIDTAFDLIAASRRLPHLFFLMRIARKLLPAISRINLAQKFILHHLHIDRLRFQKAPPLRF